MGTRDLSGIMKCTKRFQQIKSNELYLPPAALENAEDAEIKMTVIRLSASLENSAFSANSSAAGGYDPLVAALDPPWLKIDCLKALSRGCVVEDPDSSVDAQGFFVANMD